MKIIDKRSILPSLHEGSGITLELGCGSRKLHIDSIGIDLLNSDAVDLVGDIFDVLSQFPDKSVKLVTSHHFLEHVEDFFGLMKELARVLENNGVIDFNVPHFSNPYFYSDITHRRFFGLYTFCYITSKVPFRRKVPTYGNDMPFQLTAVDLLFKTDSAFPVRYIWKRLVGLVFNSCTYMQELYEDTFSNIISCYEIRYRLKKTSV